jgi:hypothetical protein
MNDERSSGPCAPPGEDERLVITASPKDWRRSAPDEIERVKMTTSALE